MPLLEVKNISKTFGRKLIVDSLSFEVNKGEIVALIGPNGAGKSTAFYMTIGLIRTDSGYISFEGQELTVAPMYVRARKGMGYLAQEPSIFRFLTVEENLKCILELLPLHKRQRIEKTSSLLNDFHLTHLRKKKGHLLSGGEKRRLEIARSLCSSPSLLLLDEPFANIDPLSIVNLKHLIRDLQKKGIGVLITDHNARELVELVDRVYLIDEGKLIAEGTFAEIVNHEEARKKYFGEGFSL